MKASLTDPLHTDSPRLPARVEWGRACERSGDGHFSCRPCVRRATFPNSLLGGYHGDDLPECGCSRLFTENARSRKTREVM
jgi:hypothetical protein